MPTRPLALTLTPALVTALMTALPTPARAAGPSFDCAKASAPVDRAICADTALADLDVSLETSFRAALKRDPARKMRLLDRQRQWLATRTAECNLPVSGEASSDNRICLHSLYKARIATLEAGSRPDAPLCQGIVDRIRESGGYLAEGGWTGLGKGLSTDRASPVRFLFEGEAMTPALLATLPSGAKDDAIILDKSMVYRIGPNGGLLAAKTDQGTMHCQAMTFFQREAGKMVSLADPVTQDEDDFCWTSSIYVGDRLPTNDRSEPTPLFANEKYSIGQSSLDLWARQKNAWQSACHIEATYDTELDVTARFCRPDAPCAALEARALALAKARDKAPADTPPDTLGVATLVTSTDGGQPNELPTFGQEDPGGYASFETGAPLYAEASSNGRITMRISHGALGWRTDENYLVAVYQRNGAALEPIASFRIHDRRGRLRSVSSH